MSDRRERIDGWKAIAAYMGKCERWCRDMANVAERGLERRMPVWHLGRCAYANRNELDAWVEAEREREVAAMRER